MSSWRFEAFALCVCACFTLFSFQVIGCVALLHLTFGWMRPSHIWSSRRNCCIPFDVQRQHIWNKTSCDIDDTRRNHLDVWRGSSASNIVSSFGVVSTLVNCPHHRHHDSTTHLTLDNLLAHCQCWRKNNWCNRINMKTVRQTDEDWCLWWWLDRVGCRWRVQRKLAFLRSNAISQRTSRINWIVTFVRLQPRGEKKAHSLRAADWLYLIWCVFFRVVFVWSLKGCYENRRKGVITIRRVLSK